MSDLLRSDARAVELLTGAERTARIEQLLLTGLDHYFSGDYDQAINLWTRVLFLDRQHDRARAYIERARSAQAERQRESEALLHEGLQAFDEGAVERARELLRAAIDRGAPHDMALGVLDRIERLELGQGAIPVRHPGQVASRTPPEPRGRLTGPARSRVASTVSLIGLALVVLTAAGAWELPVDGLATWTGRRVAPVIQTQTTPIFQAEPLPLPPAFEVDLLRAQRHFEAGRLHQALAALDRLPFGDPHREAADRLRERIQRDLLAVAAAELLPAPALQISAPERPPHE